MGADGKVVIERLCLSLPHVEKPFNSKVIKSFVPELTSRKVFRVSGFLCYLYMDIMNVLHTGMIMSISCIRIWLCYTESKNCLQMIIISHISLYKLLGRLKTIILQINLIIMEMTYLFLIKTTSPTSQIPYVIFSMSIK